MRQQEIVIPHLMSRREARVLGAERGHSRLSLVREDGCGVRTPPFGTLSLEVVPPWRFAFVGDKTWMTCFLPRLARGGDLI